MSDTTFPSLLASFFVPFDEKVAEIIVPSVMGGRGINDHIANRTFF